MSGGRIAALCRRLDAAATRHDHFAVYLFGDGTIAAGDASADAKRELRSLLRRAEDELTRLRVALPEADRPEHRVLRWLFNEPSARSVDQWTGTPEANVGDVEFRELTDNVFRVLAEALERLAIPGEADAVVTRKEIAERFGVSKSKVQRWTKEPWFPSALNDTGTERFSWQAVVDAVSEHHPHEPK